MGRAKGKWIFRGNQEHHQHTDIPSGMKHKRVTHWDILKLRTAVCPLNSITKRVTATPGLSLERVVFVMASRAVGTAHLFPSGAVLRAGSQSAIRRAPLQTASRFGEKSRHTRQSLHPYYSSGNLTVERPQRL